jgi:hypothetical protein
MKAIAPQMSFPHADSVKTDKPTKGTENTPLMSGPQWRQTTKKNSRKDGFFSIME